MPNIITNPGPVLLTSLGQSRNAPADINGYQGRLVNFYHNTYTVTRVEASERTVRLLNGDPFLGDARLYLVREEGEDGMPVGRWVEASAIAAPGKTILHWDYRTDYRADTATCEDLYRRAVEAEAHRAEKSRLEEDARRAEETRCEALWKEFTPEWAKACLVAEHRQDNSDVMTDYFSYKITEIVLLGFSKSDRNNFSEMRRMEATFPPTAHFAGSEGVEHRENYTGGSGYYLGGPSGYSGWTVRKHSLRYGLPRKGGTIVTFSHWILNH